MRICGQEFGGETIARIRELIGKGLSRTRLSQEVCRLLDWKNRAGRLKEMSCRMALNILHEKGEIVLPEARVLGFQKKASPKASEIGPVLEPSVISGPLSDLGRIELVRVSAAKNKALSRLWFDLMVRYHYLGSGTLCGAQVRYLIRSGTKGVVGAASFSSAAWKVAVRDTWIGWSPGQRVERLSQVVANSRFLILPHVQVPNLASHLLGKLVRRLPGDWEATYGERPLLLETFVEEERFVGTCYRAAGWQEIGRTAGLGRQGRGGPVKKVLVYPLVPEARSLLRGGDPVFAPSSPLPPPLDWAEEEFRGVSLPDKRLKDRLLILARDFFARPAAPLPEACGSRAKAKAAYRFFDQDEATMDVLLRPHTQATEKRMKGHPVVLCVQDTTELDYTAHPRTHGMGPIGNHRLGPIGLMMHDTLAITPDGTPLGLLDVQCWARPEDSTRSPVVSATPEEKVAARKEKEKRKRENKSAPIEEKESDKWLKSFEAVAKIQKRCPGTRLVSTGDRESDIYDLFVLAQKDPDGPELLIRAVQPRKKTDGTALWGTLLERSPEGEMVLTVPRRHNRASREAMIGIRFAKVELAPPFPRNKGLAPVTLWAIAATEKNAPEGIEPLSWLLLTTISVETLEEAREKVVWYTRRWGIEVFHRTLKSGCKIEERQLGNSHRIKACLAIDLVVAWRLYYLTKLGREIPDVPCTVFFEEHEWRALVTFHQKVPASPEAPPPTLREATRMVAGLGGFLGRKGDGEPGTQTLWRGIQRLDDLSAMWTIFTRLQVYSTSPVPTRRKYG